MRATPWLLRGWVVLALASLLWAGAPGVFLGVLAQGTPARRGWIFVQSRNGSLRLVRVSGASVHYSREVPSAQQSAPASAGLLPGTEVRITAEQDAAGEWVAHQVEILKTSMGK